MRGDAPGDDGEWERGSESSRTPCVSRIKTSASSLPQTTGAARAGETEGGERARAPTRAEGVLACVEVGGLPALHWQLVPLLPHILVFVRLAAPASGGDGDRER